MGAFWGSKAFADGPYEQVGYGMVLEGLGDLEAVKLRSYMGAVGSRGFTVSNKGGKEGQDLYLGITRHFLPSKVAWLPN